MPPRKSKMAKGEGQLGKGSYSFYLLSPLSYSLFSSFPHEYQTHEFFPYSPSFPDCNEEVSFEQQVPIPFPLLILQSDGVGAPAGSGWVIEEEGGGPFFQPKVPTAGRKRAFSLLTVAHPLIYKNGKNLDAPSPRIIPCSPFDSPPTPLSKPLSFEREEVATTCTRPSHLRYIYRAFPHSYFIAK